MKTVIIGLGVIGKVHSEVCRDLNIEVVGLCDVDGEKAERVKTKYFPNAAVFTEYAAMLETVKPDVAHICTPHYLHAQMIIECLKRDINVLCEKPLCINQTELNQILAAEKSSKAQLGVCLQNRYNSGNALVKEYLETHKTLSGYGTVLWNRDKAYYDSAEWRGKWATEGGGVMINQALHTLDLMQWFMGMPTYCSASTANLSLRGEIEVEDTAVGIFSGTSSFTFFATNSSNRDYPVEITLVTDRGVIRSTPNRVEINGEVLPFNEENKVLGKGCYGKGHLALINDFYDCVKKGKKFAIDGQEASKVMKLIFAMYKSNGEKIEI